GQAEMGWTPLSSKGLQGGTTALRGCNPLQTLDLRFLLKRIHPTIKCDTIGPSNAGLVAAIKGTKKA
ncbi:MAG: hypothetical protein LJE65_07320, partial [Desulfobacteraceae bacterium]|nr:hypothetical protein [Desulfobacteraceae bacterium]